MDGQTDHGAGGGAYRTRFLASLVASLALVTALFRLPWLGGQALVGWGVETPDAPWLAFEEPSRTRPGGALPTVVTLPDEEEPAADDEEAEADSGAFLLESAPEPPRERLEALRPILEFSEKPPELVGGLGALYLHIEYPEAAAQAGIQGRLLLEFVVEADGRPTDIRVRQSLHPLCDSAAVRALRQVAFVPGRQRGEAVRVRMRLPVRFRLVDASGLPLDGTEAEG